MEELNCDMILEPLLPSGIELDPYHPHSSNKNLNFSFEIDLSIVHFLDIVLGGVRYIKAQALVDDSMNHNS